MTVGSAAELLERVTLLSPRNDGDDDSKETALKTGSQRILMIVNDCRGPSARAASSSDDIWWARTPFGLCNTKSWLRRWFAPAGLERFRGLTSRAMGRFGRCEPGKGKAFPRRVAQLNQSHGHRCTSCHRTEEIDEKQF